MDEKSRIMKALARAYFIVVLEELARETAFDGVNPDVEPPASFRKVISDYDSETVN